MIITLVGHDTYRKKKRLDVLRSAYREKFDKQGLSVEVLEGDKIKLADFRRSCLSMGLFVAKRMVVIQNLDEAKKEVIEEIKDSIKEVPEEVILIITSKKGLGIKAAKKEEFIFLKPAELEKWLEAELKKKNLKLSSEARRYLVDSVGTDLWKLSSEVQKLSNYKKDISLADIQKFVGEPVEENVFKLTESLANKNLSNALKILHDQLDSGVNELKLLGTLAWQLKVLWQVKETNGGGTNLHPFVIRKTLPQARKFSFNDLRKLWAELLEIDISLKSKSVPARTLLDLFLEKFCRG